MNGAAKRTAAARSHERFRIQVTSNFREADLLPPSRDFASTALILLFAKTFSERSPRRMVGPERFRGGYRAGSNEVETGKYSGSWLPRPGLRRILFPAFTSVPHLRKSEIGPGKLYPVTAAQ